MLTGKDSLLLRRLEPQTVLDDAACPVAGDIPSVPLVGDLAIPLRYDGMVVPV